MDDRDGDVTVVCVADEGWRTDRSVLPFRAVVAAVTATSHGRE